MSVSAESKPVVVIGLDDKVLLEQFAGQEQCRVVLRRADGTRMTFTMAGELARYVVELILEQP